MALSYAARLLRIVKVAKQRIVLQSDQLIKMTGNKWLILATYKRVKISA